MASIRKTKAGTYKATIYVGRDVDNKQLFEYATANGLQEIKSIVREIEEDIANKTFSNVRNMKFSDYAEKWLGLIEPEIKSSTMVSYKMYIDTHFTPVFGTTKLCKIGELDIKQYISDKLKINSANTVRKHFFVLRRMLHDALKTKSPCVGIKAPKKGSFTPTTLQEEEFNLIHNAVKSMTDEIPILLAAWCGMREGEILCLKWNDINFKDSIIQVNEALSLSEDGYKENDPKSENGIREIVVDEYIMSLLETKKKDYLKNVKKEDEIEKFRLYNMRPDSFSKRFAKLLKIHNEQLVGCKPTKSHTKRSIKSQITLQSSQLPIIRFHDLRHYHATMLYKMGISDIYAAQRLGHDIMILKKIYQKLQEDMKTKEADKIKNMNKKKA